MTPRARYLVLAARCALRFPDWLLPSFPDGGDPNEQANVNRQLVAKLNGVAPCRVRTRREPFVIPQKVRP